MYVVKCGFFVEKEKGIFGVFLDGLVIDLSKWNFYGIIEVKNVIVKGWWDFERCGYMEIFM